MAAKEEANDGGNSEEYVYRISTAKDWEELQKNGSAFGGDLDKSSGFIHLSKHHQVKSTLQNFFLNTTLELILLQLDAKKGERYPMLSSIFKVIIACTDIDRSRALWFLGDGLIYEVVDGSNSFPHFYGPSRSFSPLPLDAVIKAEKITVSNGQFSCSLLN